MDGMVRRLRVSGSGFAYDAVIGAPAREAIAEVRALLIRDAFAVFVDERVYSLHGEYMDGIFAGFEKYETCLVPQGEEHKSYARAEWALNWMLEKGLSRRSSVVAVGGGVTGDFAGFVAALYMRGVPVIHLPTTLLAMVDSSIGGKVAVNLAAGKNIAGAFHQPAMVIADIHFLATLPGREFRNGLAEMVKHALIGDDDSYRILRRASPEEIARPELIAEAVYHSVRFKASIVQRDEREGGLRSILNFGHTVGHAIESLCGYSGFSHGEAVALGMRAEIEYSRRAGLLAEGDRDAALDLIGRYDLGIPNGGLDGRRVMEHMRYDKKNRQGTIRCVLLEGIGRPVYDRTIDEGLMRQVLDELLA